MASPNKTAPTPVEIESYINGLDDPRREVEARDLDAIFREVTGFVPRMWGPSIIGYGRYHYRYATGREGDMCATGFAPRKANHVIYIMPGYADHSTILKDLGKHKIGKSCLYIKKLADVDQEVLKRLIRAGLDDLATHWPVEAT